MVIVPTRENIFKIRKNIYIFGIYLNTRFSLVSSKSIGVGAFLNR
jgi:hypothetical protein